MATAFSETYQKLGFKESSVAPGVPIVRGTHKSKQRTGAFGTYKRGLTSAAEQLGAHRAPAKGRQAKAISRTLACPAIVRRNKIAPQSSAVAQAVIVGDDKKPRYVRLSNGQNVSVVTFHPSGDMMARRFTPNRGAPLFITAADAAKLPVFRFPSR